VSDKLQAGVFVYNLMQGASISTAILPVCLFLVGTGLSFATGTSWGTFGILIPIATSIFPEGSQMLVIAIASILAGAGSGGNI
ncbi:Na+/H+ antiporter NhaC family protein, partial [Mediterraneibacter gnavus]